MDSRALRRRDLVFGGVFLAFELVLVVALVLGAGSGGRAKSTVEAAPPATVGVDLREWKIEPAAVSGSPGVTNFLFDVQNHGEIPHALLIVKTDLDPSSLPVTKAKVDVAKAGKLVGEVGIDQLGPNARVGIPLTLEPGTYVFVCSIAGHYRQGMYASFQVQ
jgi:uncharacterized cupredoxin-like copper-binding protein